MCVCVVFCPDEICTLVIAEAFPEDGGLFCCTASNPYGSVNCTAHLTVTAGWYNKGDLVAPKIHIPVTRAPSQIKTVHLKFLFIFP